MGVAGGGPHPALSYCSPLPPSRLHLCAVLVLIGVGLEVAPSPGERPFLPLQAALNAPPPARGPWQALLPSTHYLPGGNGPSPRTVKLSPNQTLRPRPVPAHPDPAPPLLPQVSPAPSSSCRASCCWSPEVGAAAGAGGSGVGRAGAGLMR